MGNFRADPPRSDQASASVTDSQPSEQTLHVPGLTDNPSQEEPPAVDIESEVVEQDPETFLVKPDDQLEDSLYSSPKVVMKLEKPELATF